MKMKEVDVVAYTNHFNNRATLCPGMVTTEYKKILVTTTKPTTYERAKRLAFRLVNQEICHGIMFQNDNLPSSENKKRKLGNESNGRAR